MSALEVLKQVFPVYLLIIGGAVARKAGLVKRGNDDAVLQLVFHVMYPCFILDKILGAESVRSFGTVAWGLGTGFGLTVGGFTLAWLAAGVLRYQRGHGKRTFAVTAGVQNFGYTAIPVVESLWGTGALAVLFVHNLGVELAVWSVGVMLMSGDKSIPWRRVINGPTVSVLLGLTLVGLGWDRRVTGPPREAMHWLGAGAFPLAIFVTGALMIDLIGTERPTLKASLGGVAMRLALIPLVMLAVAKWLPMPVALKQVVMVQASMPAAMTPILLAKLYGGRPAVAVEIVVATTVASLVTLPFVLLWGRAWLGL
ncbi:AEC family transporter [Haloferula sargassicola]|uniref:AEC family transporter n=1 Tax=Haloferula sargassicola TaxID=490096 RepID=A0ABP9UML4_9BACT